MSIVDVIIPSYNRNSLTKEAIQSVLKQSFTDFTLIIVEDGSRLLDPDFFKTDKRVIIKQLPENTGASNARNAGVKISQSPFIAFLDSDDIWESTKLENQINFLNSNPEFKWVHTNERWERDGQILLQKKEHKKQGGFFLDRLMKRCLISLSSVLIRRPFFEQYGWFAPWFRVAEDYELWLRLNTESPIGFLSESLTVKRTGNWEQLSSTIEIDRYRVLALHRWYRLYKSHESFLKLKKEWENEINKKIIILKKGALKYNHLNRYAEYQRWENLFNKLRTSEY